MKKITQIKVLMCCLTMIGYAQQANAQRDFFGEGNALKYSELTDGKIITFKGVSNTNTEWITWSGPSKTCAIKDAIFTVKTKDNGIILMRNSDQKYLGRSEDKIIFVDDESSATVFTVSCPDLTNSNEVTGPQDVVFPDWAQNKGYQIRFTNNGKFLNIQTAQSGTPIYHNGKGGWSFVMVYDATNYKAPYNITEKRLSSNGSTIGATTINYYYDGESIQAPAYQFGTFTNNVKIDGTTSPISSVTVNKDCTIEYIYDWTMPFQTSVINETATDFPADTKWYLMQLRDRFISSSEGTSLTVNKNKQYGDEYWWAFSGDEANGFKIYNKAAGPGKIMTSLSPVNAESTTEPSLKNINEIDETSENQLWTVYGSVDYPNENGIYFSRKGETTKLNFNENQNKVLYWTSQNAGSTFRFVSLDNEITTLKNNEGPAIQRGAVGALKDNFATSFTAEISKGTTEGLNAAYTVTQTTDSRITFDPALYYRIENLLRKRSTGNTNDQNNGGYLEAIDRLELPSYKEEYGFYANDRDESRAQSIWKFASTSNNEEYNLLNLNANVYLGQVNTDETYKNYFKIGSNDIASATTFTLNSLGNGQYNIKQAGTNNRIHISGSYDNNKAAAMLYAGGDLNSASAWYLIPATTIDLEIGEAGYATVKYPFAVQIPTGVKAYIGTANAAEGVFTLKEIEGTTIPANTPVILEGSAKIYTLNILADNTEAPLTGNDLEGCTVYKNFETTENAYILGNGTNGIGFYQMDGTDRTLAANKAYLVLPAAASAVRSIVFSDGTTTGIESTVAEGAEAEEYYDLQGRRVMNPTKGIYVTKSGKKVLFNK